MSRHMGHHEGVAVQKRTVKEAGIKRDLQKRPMGYRGGVLPAKEARI